VFATDYDRIIRLRSDNSESNPAGVKEILGGNLLFWEGSIGYNTGWVWSALLAGEPGLEKDKIDVQNLNSD
jgi:hypothetical protein